MKIPEILFKVWDAISNETIHFNHENFSDKVACIVENDLILESLYKQLESLLNVQVRNESRLESCKLLKDGAKKSEVTLKSGEQFSCDLLVSYLFIYKIVSGFILLHNDEASLLSIQFVLENHETVAQLINFPRQLVHLRVNIFNLIFKIYHWNIVGITVCGPSWSNNWPLRSMKVLPGGLIRNGSLPHCYISVERATVLNFIDRILKQTYILVAALSSHALIAVTSFCNQLIN